jgi:hypothetical protein
MTEIQLFVIGAVASVIVWGLKMSKVTVKSSWLTILVYAVSLGLGLAFAAPALPPFPVFADLVSFVPLFLVWVGDLLVPLSAFVGFATLIYNTLLKQVLDKYAAPLFFRKK